MDYIYQAPEPKGDTGIPGPKDVGVSGPRGNPGPKGDLGVPRPRGYSGITDFKGDKGEKAWSNLHSIRCSWGYSSCPNTGAQLVYTGTAGRSHYSHKGGGI